jgi:hypothetical protein
MLKTGHCTAFFGLEFFHSFLLNFGWIKGEINPQGKHLLLISQWNWKLNSITPTAADKLGENLMPYWVSFHQVPMGLCPSI